MRKFNSLKSCTNCSMRKFNSLFRRLKIPTQMSISRLTLVFLAPFSDSLPFMHLRILTVHSRSHLLFEHRVDRNENLNQTYTCMPCERKMQQTRRLNLHNPLPLWTCQTMLVFNIFLVKTATATRDSCYRLDVENNSPEQKLECAFLSDHHECDPLAILLAPFSTFNTCFCRNGKNCQIIILKNV